MDIDFYVSEMVQIYMSHSEMNEYNIDKATWERCVLHRWDIYFVNQYLLIYISQNIVAHAKFNHGENAYLVTR